MVARQVRRSVVMSNLQIRLLPMDSDRTPLGKGKTPLRGAGRPPPLEHTVEHPCPGVPAPAAHLRALKGIGPEAAATLWSEGLFRRFSNRKQVAAYAGLAPTPWQSGSVHRDQGVSKAGKPRLRAIMIQIAWLWLRHQPQSALTLWFRARIKRTGGRLGKTMIVALARKLLVALWRYATAGVLIEGAILKPA